MATEALSNGMEVLVPQLVSEKANLMEFISFGGSGGTSSGYSGNAVTLPIGVPKVMVSTMASGDVSQDMWERVTSLMMPSIVDVAGLNKSIKNDLP